MIGIATIPACIVGGLIALRLLGLICPYSMPTRSMSPALSPGDHVLMEDFTYLFRRPRRGDLLVFAARGLPGLPGDEIYVKRIAGEPGDRVRISEGHLFINGNPVTLSNAEGEIVYSPLPGRQGLAETNEFAVPQDCFFVLGDNSVNSSDSRLFGAVPRRNIKGRIAYCYWPEERAGMVK